MKKTLPIVIALLILAALAWTVWRYVTWPRPEQQLDLVSEKNAALGYLENAQYDQALVGLAKIIKAEPNEPLGRRNYVLALFRPNDPGETTVAASAIDEVVTAAEAMLNLEKGVAAAHHVAARVYLAKSNLMRGRPGQEADVALEAARKELRETARLAPDDPAPLHELFEIEKKFGDPDQPLSQEAYTALRAAVGLAPNNLACLMDWLEELCNRNDPQAKTVLDQIILLLPPTEDGQKAGAREELQAIAPLLAKDPTAVPLEVFQKLTGARNRLQRDSEIFQQDRLSLRPHPLAFVVADFRPEFYAKLPKEAAGESTFVRFESFSPAGMDKVSGILAVAWDDLTSTGHFSIVYLRAHSDKTLVEVAARAGEAAFPPFELPGKFEHAILADLDLDIRPGAGLNVPADLDLVLYGLDGIRLLENTEKQGQRSWVLREGTKLPDVRDVRWLVVRDIDQDGNLDLVVGLAKGIRILRNSGAWTFDDVTGRSTGLEALETVAAAFGDFDRDGDPDLVVISTNGSLAMLVNVRGGQFKVANVAKHEKAMSITGCDVNNDGLLDLILGHAQGVTVLRNDPQKPGQGFTATDYPVGSAVVQLGTFDYDNDGWADLWARTADPGRPLVLWHNEGDGRLAEAGSVLPALAAKVRDLLVADVENDGDQDLILVTETGFLGLRNQGGNRNRWLRLRLQAQLNRDTNIGAAAKCNFFNVGGTIEIKAGRHYQLVPVTGSMTHLGIGNREVDVARIVWTNGVPQVVIRPKPNQVLAEEQKPKGSCPFLFSWDGDKFVWITDCLWSSALGMQLAHGVYMDHQRQENYLIVPGDKCQPKDGQYVLQFTNELWEVPYLDQVQLWAVDHPAEVEVYTNQRVPPDAKEPFRLITVGQKRTPKAAIDHKGRDVLAIIRKRDQDYLGGFTRQRYVGLAEPHWLELDLGDLSMAKEATLFLTGWIWPTDTTGNVAISQDPRFRGPEGVVGGVQPPALLVPDGKGGWKTALPMMGFQSGKLQTVAVPLPIDQFPRGDYRVRVQTSMELYWDEVFYTVDDAQVALDVHKLPVASGDLHYRGYSRTWQACRTSPHLYDYDAVDTRERWLPIPGPYTRYGDVTPVLGQTDSQVVIMSPGDELTLNFDALPPPKPGHKRTFVFYGNGWLKDFDVNGAASDRVVPLPFDGMSKYPHDDPYPGHLEAFRRQYLTRHTAGEGFYDLLRTRR